MSEFNLVAVSPEPKEWAPADNPSRRFLIYDVEFKGDQGEGFAQIKQLATTKAPEAGDTLDAEIIQKPGRVPELKRIYQQAFATGGLRAREPAERASIVRQHSQHMAVLWLATLQKQGVEPTESALKRWTDFFDADAKGES